MSIASDLTAVATNLNSALDEINTKIEAKGGTASETVYGVAAAVENLPSGGGEDILVSYGVSGNSTIQVGENAWLYTSESNAQFKMLSTENTPFVFNPASATESLRIIIRAKPTVINSGYPFITGTSSWQTSVYILISSDSSVNMTIVDSQNVKIGVFIPAGTISANNWYYFCLYYRKSEKMMFASIYDDALNLLKAGAARIDEPYNNTSRYQKLGGEVYGDNYFKGYIDIRSTFFEIDGVPVWGKTNSKTQNMGIFSITDFSEFTEVEYIEGTGTQYIDSAYYMTPQSRVVIDQQFTSVETQARFFHATSSAGSYESYINGSKYWAYSHNNGAGDWISTYVSADTNRHTMDYDCVSNKYIISGTSVNITMEGTPTQNSTVSLTLLSRTEPVNTAAKAKLYSAQIYENGILVRNLKPCYHTQSGIIGMFDTVNNKFYMNAGTGTFLKGADVNG